jgi:hypothetical protein
MIVTVIYKNKCKNEFDVGIKPSLITSHTISNYISFFYYFQIANLSQGGVLMPRLIKQPIRRNKGIVKLKYKPKLFCINDSGKQEERENSRRFLHLLFPEPSKFEK